MRSYSKSWKTSEIHVQWFSSRKDFRRGACPSACTRSWKFIGRQVKFNTFLQPNEHTERICLYLVRPLYKITWCSAIKNKAFSLKLISLIKNSDFKEPLPIIFVINVYLSQLIIENTLQAFKYKGIFLLNESAKHLML